MTEQYTEKRYEPYFECDNSGDCKHCKKIDDGGGRTICTMRSEAVKFCVRLEKTLAEREVSPEETLSRLDRAQLFIEDYILMCEGYKRARFTHPNLFRCGLMSLFMYDIDRK